MHISLIFKKNAISSQYNYEIIILSRVMVEVQLSLTQKPKHQLYIFKVKHRSKLSNMYIYIFFMCPLVHYIHLSEPCEVRNS